MKNINIRKYKSILIFTGAMLAEESGVLPYKQAKGAWNDYSWEEYACENAFNHNPVKVLEFHEERRKQILECKPGKGYLAITELKKKAKNLTIITQNVDGLHQAAGCDDVVELQGSIWEVVCPVHGIKKDKNPKYESHKCSKCDNWLRPAISWFGDMLNENKLHVAVQAAKNCDLFICAGASTRVWPAAKLLKLAKDNGAFCIEVNNDNSDHSDIFDLTLNEPVSTALPSLFKRNKLTSIHLPLILGVLIAFFAGFFSNVLFQKFYSNKKAIVSSVKTEQDKSAIGFKSLMEEASLLVKSKDYINLIDFIYGNDWGDFAGEARIFLKQTIYSAVDKLSKEENYDTAVEIIKKYIFFDNYDLPLMKKLAGLYVILGNPFNAYGTYLDIAENITDNSLKQEILSRAEKLRDNFFKHSRKEGNWEDIIDFCNEFSVKEPELSSLYSFEKARAFIGMGDAEKARVILENLLYDDNYASLAESYLKLMEGYKVPITSKQNNEVLFVSVKVNGSDNAVFIIDTGVPIVCISKNFAERIDILADQNIDLFQDENESGDSQYAPVEIADKIQVGGAEIENIAVIVKNVSSDFGKVDGLLGMNFLKHFDFTIDVNRGLLHLKRKKF